METQLKSQLNRFEMSKKKDLLIVDDERGSKTTTFIRALLSKVQQNETQSFLKSLQLCH